MYAVASEQYESTSFKDFKRCSTHLRRQVADMTTYAEEQMALPRAANACDGCMDYDQRLVDLAFESYVSPPFNKRPRTTWLPIGPRLHTHGHQSCRAHTGASIKAASGMVDQHVCARTKHNRPPSAPWDEHFLVTLWDCGTMALFMNGFVTCPKKNLIDSQCRAQPSPPQAPVTVWMLPYDS